MNTLQDAWDWFESTRLPLILMQRLALRYWPDLPWEKGLGTDVHFREVAEADVSKTVEVSLAHLDDLAVMVLFSVFEALVRARVLREVTEEAQALKHRALRLAAREAIEAIEEGSFFRVLQPFKDLHADLVEEINQVRRYRNWVAHSKRGRPPPVVTPRAAYERLHRFLTTLDEESGVESL